MNNQLKARLFSIFVILSMFLSAMGMPTASVKADGIGYVSAIGAGGTQTGTTNMTTTISLGTAKSITAGNAIIIAYTTDASPSFTLAITNSWSPTDKYQLASMGISTQQSRTYIFAAYNVSGWTSDGLTNPTITITQTVPSGGTVPSNRAAVAVEVSGLAPVGALEQSNNAPANTTAVSNTAPSAGSITTIQPVQLLIGAVGTKGNDVAAPGTWNGGFQDGPVAGNSGETISLGYQIVSSPGTYTASKTIPANRYWSAAIASFKTSTASSISYIGDIGSSWNTTSSNTLTITLAAGTSVASGDAILVDIGSNPGGTTASVAVNGVTDTAGNTYSQVVDFTSTSTPYVRTSIWAAYNVTGLSAGNTITITYASAVAKRAAVASVFRGLASTIPVDKTGGATGSSATPSATITSPPTTQADELLIGAVGTGGGDADQPGTWSNAFSAGPRIGTNAGTTTSATSDITESMGWKIVSATGSYTAAKGGIASKIWSATIATFKMATSTITHNLTIAVDPVGAGTTNPPVGINAIGEGTLVTVTANAASGYIFDHWSGDCSGPTCTVSMDGDRSVTANFIVTHNLAVAVSPSGGGTTTPAVGVHTYTTGSVVPVTALAATGYTFDEWSGDCLGTDPCSVTMDADRSVTANFTINTYALNLTFGGSGGGTVTSNVGGMNCTSDCSHDFNYNTGVTLTAAAAVGSQFAGWGGDCSGTGTCVVTMTAIHNVTATFNTIPTHTLTMAVDPVGSGTTDPAIGDHTYNEGTLVPIAATAATGYVFDHWTGNVANVNAASTTVTMSADQAPTAHFTVAPFGYIGDAGPSVYQDASGTTMAITVGSAGVAAGNTIIIGFASRGVQNYLAPAITDSKGNTYSIAVCSVAYTQGRTYMAYAPITTPLVSGDLITLTSSPAVTNRVMVASVFSGLIASSPLDQTGLSADCASTTSAVAGNNATASTTVATSQTDELVIGVIAAEDYGNTTPVDAGLGTWLNSFMPGPTQKSQNTNSYRWRVSMGRYIASAIGTFTAAQTYTNTPYWAASIATFKAAPIGPTCYALTISHTGNGLTPTASPLKSTGCSSDGQYVSGETITLSGATPDSGWQVSGWTGTSDNGSHASSNTVSMPAADHAAGVTYTEIPPTCYALTISHTGNGLNPTASPVKSTACSTNGQYVSGETITLSGADPDSGWYISGWTGTSDNASTAPTNTVSMPAADHSAGVTYLEIPPTCYTLTISHTGNGLIPTASPVKSTSCSTNGQYVAGETITLSGATPDSGWQVSGWTGTSDNLSTASSNTLNMPASDHAAGVTYTLIPPTCYALTISHTGNGDNPTASPVKSNACSTNGQYVAGESISLTGANPDSGWHVSGWTGTSANGSTASSNSLSMPASAQAVSVIYLQTCYALTISHTGNGDNPTASPVKSTSCSSDGQYVSGESISLSGANPDSGWHVSGWTGTSNNGSTASTNSLTMPASAQAVSVIYSQIPCYALTISHTGNGLNPTASPVKSSSCSTNGQYVAGEAISLTGANPDSGWHVSGWTGTSNNGSTASTNSLTMPASAQAVSVTYLQTCYALTISHTGNGDNPTASPVKSTSCSSDGQYVAGENITLDEANPDPGWEISGWTGTSDNLSTASSNSLTMPASAQAVSVIYIQTCYDLSISHTGNGDNPTASPVKSTSCSTNGQYVAGETISLTGANPDSGWQVSGWTGTNNNTSTASSNSLTMPASVRAVSVTYTQICYSLTISHNGNGTKPTASPVKSTSCSTNGQYVSGQTITLSEAVPDSGWQVSGWTGTSNNLSTASSNTVNMPVGDHAAGVTYTLIPATCYALTISHTGNGSDPTASPLKSPDCSTNGQYIAGQAISLSGASPTSGSHISGWAGTSNDISTANSNSLTMPASAKSVSVIYALDVITYNVPLQVGWNLVSFNLHPVSTLTPDVLSTISSKYDLVYAWDATTGSWMKYDPNAAPYASDLTDLDETMGFWIKMNTAATLVVSGTPPVTSTIVLQTGWNLVSFPATANLALPSAFSDHGMGTDYSLVYAYHASDTADPWKLFNTQAPAWANDLTSLAPGWGYWIKVDVAHPWDVTY